MIQIPQHLNYFMIFKWTDIIEILVLSTFIFYFSCWLKKDHQKKLLPTFYGICLLFITTHYLHLTTLSSFIFSFSPALITIFILLHQKVIQKNFVAAKNLKPINLQKLDWVQSLVKTLLSAVDSKKEVQCLIECKDLAEEFAKPGIIVNTIIQKDILDYLIDSSQFNTNKFLWINQEGLIKAINSEWNLPEEPVLLEEKKLSEWEKNSIKISSKLDVITLKTCSITRTFSIIAQGKIIENIFTDKAINLIQQFIKKSEFNHANNSIKERGPNL